MDFLTKLLSALNIKEEEYYSLIQDKNIDDIESPQNFYNVNKAKERILKAIKNNEKIVIYGDYDCDGISATSILVLAFKKLGIKVGYYIPSRYLDGYGINETMVNKFYEKGYSLIITVDNGVSQFEALSLAKKLGIDVILTDHHQLNETIPECYTIIHPSLKEEPFFQCGAYVAFMLATSLLGYKDDYLITLAALATISDMMPVKGYNRDIIKIALNILKNKHFLPFDHLLNYAPIESEKNLSFGVVPKINSLGRVLEDTKVNKAVTFLTSDSKFEIEQIGQLILDTLEKRKNLTDEAFNLVDVTKHLQDDVIVSAIDGICEGVIGLVAQKVLMETNKPCVILTKEKNSEILKGSARSLEGFDIASAFNQMDDILLTHGGHALAGGVSLKKENLEEFSYRINALCKGQTLKKKSRVIIPLEKEDFTFQNLEILKSLSPFGEGFEEPYFSIKVDINEMSYLSEGKHIKGTISPKAEYLAFNLGDTRFKQQFVTIVGKLQINEFRGLKKILLNVEDILQECE